MESCAVATLLFSRVHFYTMCDQLKHQGRKVDALYKGERRGSKDHHHCTCGCMEWSQSFWIIDIVHDKCKYCTCLIAALRKCLNCSTAALYHFRNSCGMCMFYGSSKVFQPDEKKSTCWQNYNTIMQNSMELWQPNGVRNEWVIF